MAMHDSLSALHSFDLTGFKNIDYGEVSEWRELWPEPFPYVTPEKWAGFEKLGNVDLVRKALIHEGGFWMWMRPDR
jgi:hypothetical protein